MNKEKDILLAPKILIGSWATAFLLNILCSDTPGDVLPWLRMLMWSQGGVVNERLVLVPQSFWNGEYWRLFTFAFTHFDLLHLYANAYFLLRISRLLIAQTGTGWFWVVNLCGNLSAGLVCLLATHPTDSYTTGASAGIFALFGFFGMLLILRRDRPDRYMPVSQWLVCLAYLMLTNLIGWDTVVLHLSGFAAGVVLAAIYQTLAQPGMR